MSNYIKEEIIIYGTGDRYTTLKDKVCGQYNVIAIVDSDSKKQGFVTNGYKIIAPDQIVNYKYDFIWISSTKYYQQIYNQLIYEYGVEREKIKPLNSSLLLEEMLYLYDDKIKYQREILNMRELIIRENVSRFEKNNNLISIISYQKKKNEISRYWTEHTVHEEWFISAEESYQYCLERFDMYPKLREFLELDRDHSSNIVLDYGCGVGHDTIWFTLMCKAKCVIGMDVSEKALKSIQYRLALHNVQPADVELVQVEETEERLPIKSGSVDFINCQGVLMHTSNPVKILREFYRVLIKQKKNESCMNIMVYNKDSIYYHLYVAYYLRFVDNRIFAGTIEENEFEKFSIEEIFERSVDGIGCPKAACWTQGEFTDMLHEAGFENVKYEGGYSNNLEKVMVQKYLQCAIEDERLEEEHRKFLVNVKFNEEGYPMYNGKICGLGGAYLCYF